MKFANLCDINKAYTEGIYADTPQNRKLGRVGMTYTAYAEKLKKEDSNKEKEIKPESKRLNKLFPYSYLKVTTKDGRQYLIKNSSDWCYTTKDGVVSDKNGNIIFWSTQTIANQMGPSYKENTIPFSNIQGTNELLNINPNINKKVESTNKKEMLLNVMKATLSKQLGFNIDLTIIRDNEWTISYLGKDNKKLSKINTLFNNNKYKSIIETDYDEELDETFCYINFEKK